MREAVLRIRLRGIDYQSGRNSTSRALGIKRKILKDRTELREERSKPKPHYYQSSQLAWDVRN